jgi:hypothetical protein
LRTTTVPVVGSIVGTFPPFIAVAGVVMVNVTRPMVTVPLRVSVPFGQLVHFQRSFPVVPLAAVIVSFRASQMEPPHSPLPLRYRN